MNARLGNVGKTVFYTDPVDANPVNQTDSLKELVGDMNAGKVDLLVILGGNPVYDAPSDLNSLTRSRPTRFLSRVHYGLYQDETAELCQWHVNATHELEAWGDARSYDGTVSLIQPLISPLYNGKSAIEFVALLSGQSDATGYDLLRAHWQKQHAGEDFEKFWRKSLHDGWIEGTTFAPKSLTAKAPAPADSGPKSESAAIELNIRRDSTIYDGQFANNGWLQELPKPMSKLTWDNAIQIGPKMAQPSTSRPRMLSNSISMARKSPARSGFKRGIPTIPSPSPSATAASAPAALAPRKVLTPTPSAPPPLRGSLLGSR